MVSFVRHDRFYHDRLAPIGSRLKIREQLVLLDTFAVPSLLATPL